MAIARALDLAPSEAVADQARAVAGRAGHASRAHATSRPRRPRGGAQRELHAFARELVSALQFYQNQPGSLGIGEVVLTGGTAELPGIDAELGRLIGVPVRLGDPLVNVKVGKKVGREQPLGSLATAIGLGIEI